jgi:zinc protease
MRSWLKAAVTSAALSFLLFGSAVAAGLEVRVADNVYVVPDPKAKVVTLWMVVHAGCRDEAGGNCVGLAHYLEHLMFLGGGADHNLNSARAFSAGQTNAFTTLETTAYYQTAPVREGQVTADLDKLFSLYAERLRGLDVAEDAALREKNVVLQEFNYRRTDSPRAMFYAAINRKLQPEHPAGQSIIGSRDDIAAFTVERAKAFHDRWYGKNNIEFIAYGPISADDVKGVAAKYFDALPMKKIPSRSWLDARRSFEPMLETVAVADPEIKRTEVIYEKIVRYEVADPAVSSVSNSILLDYMNSQMTGSLSDVFVEQKKLATDVRISQTSLGAGVMWYSIAATLEDGVQANTLESALDDYLRGLADTGIGRATVERF